MYQMLIIIASQAQHSILLPLAAKWNVVLVMQ